LEPDESRRRTAVEGHSANHFELAFTECDFLLDFGQLYDDKEQALIHTRIILTPRSAKTFLTMLQDLVKKYEQTIGAIAERQA
jgi:hypothetical protein